MIASIDAALLDAIAALRNPALDSFFSLATWAGSLWFLLPAALLLVAAAGPAWPRRSILVTALAVTSLACHILKIVIDRPRPELHPLIQALPLDASFPSAHAAQASAFFSALWLAMPDDTRRHWGIPLGAVIFIVGFSRLYLQVHWPSDVLVGALLGVTVSLLFDQFSRHQEIT